MGTELIGQDLSGDISALPNHEDKFKPGDQGIIQIYVNSPLSDYQIKQLEDELRSKGVILLGPVTQDSGVLLITFQK